MDIMGTISDAWVRKQLHEVEKLQKIIVSTQREMEKELGRIRDTTNVIFSKISDIDEALEGNLSPELEKAVKQVAMRAVSIDQKVTDQPKP